MMMTLIDHPSQVDPFKTQRGTNQEGLTNSPMPTCLFGYLLLVHLEVRQVELFLFIGQTVGDLTSSFFFACQTVRGVPSIVHQKPRVFSLLFIYSLAFSIHFYPNSKLAK